MPDVTSLPADALLRGVGRKTQTNLKRLLKRDRLTLAQFMDRAVTAYDLMYQPHEYRPPGAKAVGTELA